MNTTTTAQHIATVTAQLIIALTVGINAYGDFRVRINTGMSSMRNADRHGDDQCESGKY